MIFFGDIFSDTEKKILIISILVALFSLGALFFHILQNEELIFSVESNSYAEVYLSDVKTLNPLFTSYDSPEEDVDSFIFSSLITRNDKGLFDGDIASVWAVNDSADEYTFIIRDDVVWHDGVEFSMSDVLFTLSLLTNEDIKTKYGNIFRNIKYRTNSIDKITFILNTPDVFFIRNFTFPILPEHLLSSSGPDLLTSAGFNMKPIGTGLFEFQSIQTEDKFKTINLSKNDDYFSEKPNISKLVFHFFTDEEAYLKHEDKFSKIVTSEKIQGTDESNPDYIYPVSQYRTLFFNTESAQLLNPAVRRAISKSLKDPENKEKQVIKKNLLFPNTTKIEEDKKKAKEILYSSGWQLYSTEFSDDVRRNIRKEKLSLKMITLDEPEYMDIADSIQKDLLEVGIEVKYAGFAPSELSYDFLKNHTYDMLLLGIKVQDPDDMFPYLHSSQIRADNGLNLSLYENLEVDLLLEDMRTSVTRDRKEKVREEIRKRIDTDIPMIFISQGELIYSVPDRITDIKIPDVVYNYKDRFIGFENWNIN